MSGSGVLLGGEMASGVIPIRGLSCRNAFFFKGIALEGRDTQTKHRISPICCRGGILHGAAHDA